MKRHGGHRPRQTLSKDKSDVSPGPHVSHNRHPTKALEEKFRQGSKISHSLDRVRQKLHFKALFGNQTSNEQIVRRAVLDRGVAAEFVEMLSRGNNRLAKREFDSVQLPRDQDAGVEITHHADGLELLEKGVLVCGNIQTGHRADFRIAERRDHGTQIVRPNANVAVVDGQDLVLRFADQPGQLHHFVIGRGVSGNMNHSNAALWKIPL